jgi:hypothetical protein
VIGRGVFAQRGRTVTGESRYKKLEAVELLPQPGGFEGFGSVSEQFGTEQFPVAERA